MDFKPKEKTYLNFFSNSKGLYSPNDSSTKEEGKLPPGVYDAVQTPDGKIFFKASKFTHDSLIDIPDTTYKVILEEIKNFLAPETKRLFKEYGYLYKRSTLLYGKPGTGKTCTVNRVAQEVVESVKGVVIFNPNPQTLIQCLRILDDIQPETTIMVVFEELDELIKRYESELLNILDGEIQKENIIYAATTNFIDAIPQRIVRPGRFSSVLEAGFPSKKAREVYLRAKGVSEPELSIISANTAGFSIDELKEVVLAVKCLKTPLEEVIKRISNNNERFKEVRTFEDPEDKEWAVLSNEGLADGY